MGRFGLVELLAAGVVCVGLLSSCNDQPPTRMATQESAPIVTPTAAPTATATPVPLSMPTPKPRQAPGPTPEPTLSQDAYAYAGTNIGNDANTDAYA